MLVTGKISQQLLWLEPKSSDFALELFLNPGSRKAEEAQCDHSHSRKSLRVSRMQVLVPDRTVWFFRGKMNFQAPLHIQSWLQLSCYCIPTHGLRAASAQLLIPYVFRSISRVGTGKRQHEDLPLPSKHSF